MSTRRERERREYQYASAQERVEKHETGFTPSSFAVPEGMKLFRFKKAGTYELDVFPYIAGEGNPYAKKGQLWYERTFFVHTSVGPDEKHVLCLKRNFREDCPGCENVVQHQVARDLDDDSLKALRAKERQLFLLYDRSDPESGLQLFENSYFFGLGQNLDNKIQASLSSKLPGVQRFQNFWKPYDGMSLSVTVASKAWKGQTTYKITNIEMVPREDDLPDELLDAAPCLDDLIVSKKLSYKQFKDILEAVHEEEEEGEEEKGNSDDKSTPYTAREETLQHEKPNVQGVEVGSFRMYKGKELEVLKVNNDGTFTGEDEDEKVYTNVNPSETTLVEVASTNRPEARDEVPFSGQSSLNAPTVEKTISSVAAPNTKTTSHSDIEDDLDDDLEEKPRKASKPTPYEVRKGRR